MDSKKHIATNQEGYSLSVHTPSANCSDTKNLSSVLEKIEIKERTPVFTDKGYSSEQNKCFFQEKRLKSRRQHKASRGRALTNREIAINKAII